MLDMHKQVKETVDQLDLDLTLSTLGSLLGGSNGLGSHDTTSPVALGLLVLLEVTLLDGLDELGELVLVLSAHFGDSEGGGGLLVNDRSETSLALDNGVWNTHLSAESWEEDDQLDGVHIVGNEDKRGLLGLDERHNVVKTVLDGVWLLAHVLLLLALGDSGSLLVQTLLLLGLGLWSVLVEELERLGGGVAVEGVGELSDSRWDLETHVQDLALALQTNVLWPLHHTAKVAAWLDVLANAIVAWTALNERVLGLLLADTGLGGREWRRSSLLSTALCWRLSLRRTISDCCLL